MLPENLLMTDHFKRQVHTDKKTGNRNDCDGILGKSKQVAICAPSCSAVQFGVQDEPWPEPLLSKS